MIISKSTLEAVAAAINSAREAWALPEEIAMAALEAFAAEASLNDWDEFQRRGEIPIAGEG